MSRPTSARVVCAPRLLAPLLLVLLAGPAAAGEVVPEGTRLTHEDATVHLGPWHDYATWTYLVQRGDTLSEIAERELGTLRRMPGIRALNPGLVPERLKPGQRLRMPPRKRPAPYDAPVSREPDAPRPWWDFFVLPVFDDGPSPPAPVNSGHEIPWHRDGATLFAVRHDHVDRVLGALDAAPGRGAGVLERFALDGIVATSPEVLGGRRVVDATSEVHYGVTEYEVRHLAGGRIELTRLRRRELDANREVIGGPGDGPGRLEIALLAMGLAALAGIVLAVRRRGPAGVEMPVSSAT